MIYVILFETTKVSSICKFNKVKLLSRDHFNITELELFLFAVAQPHFPFFLTYLYTGSHKILLQQSSLHIPSVLCSLFQHPLFSLIFPLQNRTVSAERMLNIHSFVWALQFFMSVLVAHQCKNRLRVVCNASNIFLLYGIYSLKFGMYPDTNSSKKKL